MKASDTERSSNDLPATDSVSIEAGNPALSQLKPAPAATAPKRSIVSATHADWPLPPPITETETAPSRPKSKPAREVLELSAADLETLEALQARCKDCGVKIKKNKLLTAGLQLLATAPTGKLLAVLGPLESVDESWKHRKRKAPSRS